MTTNPQAKYLDGWGRLGFNAGEIPMAKKSKPSYLPHYTEGCGTPPGPLGIRFLPPEKILANVEKWLAAEGEAMPEQLRAVESIRKPALRRLEEQKKAGGR